MDREKLRTATTVISAIDDTDTGCFRDAVVDGFDAILADEPRLPQQDPRYVAGFKAGVEFGRNPYGVSDPCADPMDGTRTTNADGTRTPQDDDGMGPLTADELGEPDVIPKMEYGPGLVMPTSYGGDPVEIAESDVKPSSPELRVPPEAEARIRAETRRKVREAGLITTPPTPEELVEALRKIDEKAANWPDLFPPSTIVAAAVRELSWFVDQTPYPYWRRVEDADRAEACMSMSTAIKFMDMP